MSVREGVSEKVMTPEEFLSVWDIEQICPASEGPCSRLLERENQFLTRGELLSHHTCEDLLRIIGINPASLGE